MLHHALDSDLVVATPLLRCSHHFDHVSAVADPPLVLVLPLHGQWVGAAVLHPAHPLRGAAAEQLEGEGCHHCRQGQRRRAPRRVHGPGFAAEFRESRSSG